MKGGNMPEEKEQKKSTLKNYFSENNRGLWLLDMILIIYFPLIGFPLLVGLLFPDRIRKWGIYTGIFVLLGCAFLGMIRDQKIGDAQSKIDNAIQKHATYNNGIYPNGSSYEDLWSNVSCIGCEAKYQRNYLKPDPMKSIWLKGVKAYYCTTNRQDGYMLKLKNKDTFFWNLFGEYNSGNSSGGAVCSLNEN